MAKNIGITDSKLEEDFTEPTTKMRPGYSGECCPITNLTDIVSVLEDPPDWVTRVILREKRGSYVIQNTISDCHEEYSKFTAKPRLDKRFIPKTLVCHDYKGGYLEDRYLSRVDIGNCYTFYNWAHIDIFVYFSHYLITIPPLSWINTAHKNGVKILGTLITEHDQGIEICDEFLRDENTLKKFATQLKQILQIFGFDGWLLNIENQLKDTENLKKFVEYLTTIIHKDNPENVIIWYDSVIENGKLKWQNELNEFNKCFFDRCDGIFLNYVWTEQSIKKSLDLAQYRSLDVYVGIDIFGRNTFGGGQFNSFKAAQIIRRYGLSMAIFASGWTHENLKEENDSRVFFEKFINTDCAFWNSLWPYLYTYPIAGYFETDFFIGITDKCYDLLSQQQQLSKIKHPKNWDSIQYKEIPTLNNKCNCLQIAFDMNGIKCLITKQFLNNQIKFIHRLFICDIEIKDDLILYYIRENNGTNLTLNLLITNDYGNLKVIKCLNQKKNEKLINHCGLMEINPIHEDSVIESIHRMYNTMLENQKLNILAYKLNLAPCTLLEIGCTLENGHSVLLHAFGLKQV